MRCPPPKIIWTVLNVADREYMMCDISPWVDFDFITPYSSPLGHPIFGLNSGSVVAGCAYTNCSVDIIQCD